MTLYFDSAATSFPKPPPVIESVTAALSSLMGNPFRSPGRAVERELFRTREAIAALFGIRQSARIVFTLNATSAINLALFGLLREGDRVITTSMEHNAVVRPLARLRETRGIAVEIVRGSDEGFIDPSDLARALDRPARLIVMNHASNVCGAWNEIAEVGRIAREHDCLFMVDASQSAGVIPIDVERDRIDVLACSGHKNLLGPSGTGICYLSPGINIDPLIYGGTGSASDRETMPEVLPERFEAGTLNFHGLIGLGAAVRFILETGIQTIFDAEIRLAKTMQDRLSMIGGLEIAGPASSGNRLPVFPIRCPGQDPAMLGNLLDELGVMTRTGLHCAPWAHRTIGTYPLGAVRISAGFLTPSEHIEMLGRTLESAVERLRA